MSFASFALAWLWATRHDLSSFSCSSPHSFVTSGSRHARLPAVASWQALLSTGLLNFPHASLCFFHHTTHPRTDEVRADGAVLSLLSCSVTDEIAHQHPSGVHNTSSSSTQHIPPLLIVHLTDDKTTFLFNNTPLSSVLASHTFGQRCFHSTPARPSVASCFQCHLHLPIVTIATVVAA